MEMDLRFGSRAGNHETWSRTLVVRVVEAKDDDSTAVTEHGPFLLTMETREETGEKKRYGAVHLAGVKVWSGTLPKGPPPTRAFAMAAGLCDESGGSGFAPPAWVTGQPG